MARRRGLLPLLSYWPEPATWPHTYLQAGGGGGKRIPCTQGEGMGCWEGFPQDAFSGHQVFCKQLISN